MPLVIKTVPDDLMVTSLFLLIDQLANLSAKQVKNHDVNMTFFRQPLREPYWTLIMSICTVATLPVIVVFLSLQRYFIEGVVISGLK